MIHIIIREEKRKDKNRQAQTINNDLRTPDGTDANGMPKYTITPRPPQLHTMAEEVTDMSNIAYAAEWDGKAPYVTVLAGDIANLKLAYFGWPMVTKEQWKLENPIG